VARTYCFGSTIDYDGDPDFPVKVRAFYRSNWLLEDVKAYFPKTEIEIELSVRDSDRLVIQAVELTDDAKAEYNAAIVEANWDMMHNG
jgi:hypothetical protein